MERKAIYAGTFDPITLGHIDLVERAAKACDHLKLCVAESTSKKTLFSVEQRMALAQECCSHIPNLEVVSFDGLLVDFAHAQGVQTLIRGLRAFSDFEYEFQMALTNRQLAPDIETLFLMPNESYSYVSSSLVREIARHGGDVRRFVPPAVEQALKDAHRAD